MDDGASLLTGERVGPLLKAAVEHAGGRLTKWRLDQVDTNPESSTTATYRAEVDWPHGNRVELLGVSARAQGLSETDANAEIFADGNREVAVWLYPNDPDLPGLKRATHPDLLCELFNRRGTLSVPVTSDDLKVAMIGYRPRRRAVVRVRVLPSSEVLYIKVLRPSVFPDVLAKHELLLDAGVASPEIACATSDQLLVLRKLPGRSLARAIFDTGQPCTAEGLVQLLDSMPPAVAKLSRRPPWSDAVEHYAEMVSVAMPELSPRIDWATQRIVQGLHGYRLGSEPTHGDFHEGQLRVRDGQVTGMLDVDTIGPGRRADDLACLIAHLSTIQRMSAEQEAKVHELLRNWVPVFDERVDPIELRLRAAAVVISLATGPYRSQEKRWRETTANMVGSAVALVQQVD